MDPNVATKNDLHKACVDPEYKTLSEAYLKFSFHRQRNLNIQLNAMTTRLNSLHITTHTHTTTTTTVKTQEIMWTPNLVSFGCTSCFSSKKIWRFKCYQFWVTANHYSHVYRHKETLNQWHLKLWNTPHFTTRLFLYYSLDLIISAVCLNGRDHAVLPVSHFLKDTVWGINLYTIEHWSTLIQIITQKYAKTYGSPKLPGIINVFLLFSHDLDITKSSLHTT